MSMRHWLLLLLPAFLGVVVILGWQLRELASATEESARELSTARERLGASRSDLQGAKAEAERLRKELDRREVDLRSLRTQLAQHTLVDEIARILEKVRGLPLRRPLRVRWVDRAFTRKYVRASIERHLPRERLEAYTATFAKLGLLPANFPLARTLEELMAEQAAGFYDPRTATLYARAEMPAGELVLSHEIAHALQDQHFDLARLLVAIPDHDDRGFALHALVEGDATLATELYLRETLSLWKVLQLVADVFEILNLDQKKVEAAPQYLRETLLRSYLGGKAFVEALHRRGGWKRVERAYRDPPRSSEQILHPAKYLRGEEPVPVTIPALERVLGVGWKPLHENTVGELGVLALLGGAAATRERARQAAEGWGGDRLRSYRGPDGRLVLVWRTVWDSGRDASEFREGMTAFLEERHGRATAPNTWKGAGGEVRLVALGRTVLLVDGAATAAQAESVAEAAGR
jgi:hypothetical protein